MRHIVFTAVGVLLFAAPAAALELAGQLTQGGLVVGTVVPGTTVTFEDRRLRVDPRTGTFVFGIGRDHNPEATLTLTHPDGRVESRVLAIAPREWQIERIEGLPPRKVTPSLEDAERIIREGLLINQARSRNSAEMFFTGGFIQPTPGRVSGRYGSQRVLNGKPRRPHLGLDIAAPAGSPVQASAAGEVVLAEGDLFYTGGTVAIDHGHGVTTIYSHLASVDVSVGNRVAQGDRVGTVGATGRATGPHLDWRINWFNVRLDPELVLSSQNESTEQR